jgi:tRNA A-37 threonylcarbamoyl transferase component Bud32/membrane protein CcdC involved in cytochrome C biogenesis
MSDRSPERASSAISGRAGPRPALVFNVPAAGADITPLLRQRLIIVALLATLTSAFFSLFRMQIPAQWEYFQASALGRGLLLFEPIMFVTSVAFAVSMWRYPRWSLRGLRYIESVLIGFFAIYIAWSQLFAWTGSRFALGNATVLDTFIVRQAVDSMAGRWFAVIVGISMLVPETVRRNAMIVGVLACSALAVTMGMAASDPLYRPHLGSMLALMAFWMAVAATIAIFGSYKLAELRQQVSDARKLGQYRLARKIGEGAMGEVFLAEHLMLKQPCAIKLIRPELAANRTAMQRFEREVHAISQLKHWNTVQIYDYGYAEDGTFYFAMEYLDGLTLEALVREHGPLPAGRAIHFLRQVCGALREAHAIQLVHRDIKPANVIVCVRAGQYDVAKLLDFGMVRQVGREAIAETVTNEGAIVGTPAYMSPEQIESSASLDGRSDIYSVGAVAYFLLTGVPPFHRDSPVQILLAHLHDAPVSLRESRPDVPRDLEAVVLRCLGKAPEDRFEDVDALDRALADCVNSRDWTSLAAEAWWKIGRGGRGSAVRL